MRRRLSVLAAMAGLRRLPSALAARLRVAQMRAVDGQIVLQVAVGVIGIAFVAIVGDTLSRWVMATWVLSATFAVAAPLTAAWTRRRTDYESVSRAAMFGHAAGLLAQAVIWAVPMLLLHGHLSLVEQVLLWTMLSCLMTLVVLGCHAAPLGALLFLAIVGMSGATMMSGAGTSLLPAMGGLFALLLIVVCTRQADLFGRQFWTEAQLVDHQATVRMLLREHHGTGADWLWQVDADGRLRDVGSAFAEMMRCSVDRLEGQPLVEVLCAGQSMGKGALDELKAHLTDRQAFANLIVPVEVAGVRRWWELSAAPRCDDRGHHIGFHGVASDVTTEQEAQARIAQLARFDLLTKLPNRLHLTESLGEAIEGMLRSGRGCAILMIDLDRFKAVNDTYGHQTGDLLLAQVGERLRAVCPPDVLCGRLGGDEFAVVMRDAGGARAVHRLADAIIAVLAEPFHIDMRHLSIGASIGSAMAPADGRTPDALMRCADLAMYRAKQSGGDRHCAFQPALRAHAEARRTMELALRDAIVREEMSVQYQPVLDLGTGDLAGFEALARWHHPELGEVSPLRFIPVAEEARLIESIGEWVLRKACLEARSWPEPLGLSVNMSADQFYDPEIVAKVDAALREADMAPDRLELEVTESLFLREGGDAVRKLEQLRDLGVRLALDDFGTGQSSLAYLPRTRFGSIKIDRSFVAGAARGEHECIAIMKAVVALADSLDIATVAEGVETETELHAVRSLGCTRVQGFYFGQPMRTEDVRAYFRSAAANRTATPWVA